MSETFQVIFTGALQPGKDAERIVELFSEKFKLERAVADKLVRAGRPVVLKKGLDLEKAEKYLSVLRLLGMVVELNPKPKPPEPPPAPKTPTGLSLEPLDNGGDDTTEVLEHSSDSLVHCPKCGSGNMVMGICQDCGIVAAKYMAAQSRQAEAGESGVAESTANPYNAPEAELEQPFEGELSGPRAVPAGDGLSWISQGWGYFKDSPGGWILAMGAWLVISTVGGLIPFVGGLAMSLLGPVIMAGFMIGCREQDEGGEFTVSHLFAGFSHNTGQLVLVGVLYLVMFAVVGAIIMVGVFFSLGAGLPDPDAARMANDGPGLGFILLMVLAFILSIMISMAYVFAPPLVALENLNAIEAMKLSFKGCVMNLLPLFLFGLVAIVLLFIGILPVGLGLLVVMPMLTAGSYAAYRDIYYE